MTTSVLDEERTDHLDGSAVRTHLKWFNVPKGFGFVVPENTNTDAFLHITTLQRAGIRAIGEAAILICELEKGPKGAQVRRIVELLEQGLKPEKVSAAPHLVTGDNASGTNQKPVRIDGTVKWYKPDKGFGFVTPDDGQKDVFIHQTCLQQHGMDDLVAGLRLSMQVKIVPKGREVLDFEVIED